MSILLAARLGCKQGEAPMRYEGFEQDLYHVYEWNSNFQCAIVYISMAGQIELVMPTSHTLTYALYGQPLCGRAPALWRNLK